MSHVFISYSQTDRDFAEVLIHRLREAGLDTWTDDSLGLGEEWREMIDQAIRTAFALIVVMTPEAKASEYVTYEWAVAWGAQIPVMPILLKPTKLHPRLEALQYLDFTNTRSRDWSRLAEELKKKARTAQNVYTIPVPDNAPPFVQRAIAAIDSWNIDERRGAVHALAKARFPECLDTLRLLLGHPLLDVRIVATKSLTHLKDRTIVPTLVAFLEEGENTGEEEEADLIVASLDALGQLGDPSELPLMFRYIKDRRASIRRTVVYAISTIIDSQPEKVLSEVYTESMRDDLECLLDAGGTDPETRIRALKALARLKGVVDLPTSLKEWIYNPINLIHRQAGTASSHSDRLYTYAFESVDQLGEDSSLIAAYGLIAIVTDKFNMRHRDAEQEIREFETSPRASDEARDALKRWRERQSNKAPS